ncbi:MAG: flavodoxin family protein [Promethearchaeota archaeon]
MNEKTKTAEVTGKPPIKSLLVVFSYHTMSTMKVAQTIANVLGAKIKHPHEIHPKDLLNYDLVGFGSGIYDAKHHKFLFDLVDKLPQISAKKAFLFSTAGMTGTRKVAGDHSKLRSKLQAKGYDIVGDFGCKGFNTNSFLKYFGGMNKGKPDADDLGRAEAFAHNLL